MGQQQWASGMTDVDKAQLTRIETNTGTIPTELGKMLWWDKYNNELMRRNTAVGGSGANVTLLNIAGAGYLSSAYAIGIAQTECYLRIFVDGSLVHSSGFTVGNFPTGVMQSSDLVLNGSGQFVVDNFSFGSTPINATGGSHVDYPANWNRTDMIVLSQPIFFKTSLQISYVAVNGGATGIDWVFKGGIKI